MCKYCVENLPAEYSEALVIDANDKKSSSGIKIAAGITAVVLFNLVFFLYILPRIREIAAGFSILKCVGFFVSYVLYVILHELTHGAV